MTTPDPASAPTIAVIDVGKTNAKLALVDAGTLGEVAVETRPNTVLPGPPWPHFDLDGHWAFFVDALRRLGAVHRIDGISITTHGASAVLLAADGSLAAPMLDYEHGFATESHAGGGPADVAADYDAIRPPFAQTGSARLPGGLNVGAQLYWQFRVDPGLADRTAHILTYPQYWAWRLTGVMATEVTSLGCHTDLWQPQTREFSSLVDRLGIAGKLPPARTSASVLGTLTRQVATATGLPLDTPVACGIHDSNASLFPHLLGQTGPFAVVSTGTWVICMAVGAAHARLDPARDCLINTDARGNPVPSARFMGGREYERIRDGCDGAPTRADRDAVLRGVMLLPSVEAGSGPFPGSAHRWRAMPESPGARMLALAYYLALMTDTCLNLIGTKGPAIVEGPFARNADYLAMLAAIRPDGVMASAASTGTSAGSACLLLDDPPYAAPAPVSVPGNGDALREYAARWRAATA